MVTDVFKCFWNMNLFFIYFVLGAAKLMLLCDVFLKCPQIGRKNLIKYPTNSYVCGNVTWEEVFLTFVNVRFVRVQQRRWLSSVPLLSGRVVYLVPSVLISHQSDVDSGSERFSRNVIIFQTVFHFVHYLWGWHQTAVQRRYNSGTSVTAGVRLCSQMLVQALTLGRGGWMGD